MLSFLPSGVKPSIFSSFSSVNLDKITVCEETHYNFKTYTFLFLQGMIANIDNFKWS